MPNTTNVSFEDVEAESLLMALDLLGLAVRVQVEGIGALGELGGGALQVDHEGILQGGAGPHLHGQLEVLGHEVRLDRLEGVDGAADGEARAPRARIPQQRGQAHGVDVEDAAEIRELRSYPPDSAGGIMTTDGCGLARMSGSGATCFGLYESVEAAQAAERAMRKAHPEWWVAGGVLGDMTERALPRG